MPRVGHADGCVSHSEAIRDHIAASFAIEVDDFDYVPFAQRGGLGKANQVFGKDLGPLLSEMNEVLAA